MTIEYQFFQTNQTLYLKTREMHLLQQKHHKCSRDTTGKKIGGRRKGPWGYQVYLSNSGNKPSDEELCSGIFSVSITLLPSVYTKYLFTWIGTYKIIRRYKISLIWETILNRQNQDAIFYLTHSNRYNLDGHVLQLSGLSP